MQTPTRGHTARDARPLTTSTSADCLRHGPMNNWQNCLHRLAACRCPLQGLPSRELSEASHGKAHQCSIHHFYTTGGIRTSS